MSRNLVMADERWQIEQGNACNCKGGDDMCPCQNVSPADRVLKPTVISNQAEIFRVLTKTEAALALHFGSWNDEWKLVMELRKAIGLLRQGICTNHEYPPIPIRQFDWAAYRDGYEPPDSDGVGGGKVGWGRTENEAIADLLELEDDA